MNQLCCTHGVPSGDLCYCACHLAENGMAAGIDYRPLDAKRRERTADLLAMRPLLAETPEDALRMAVAGRRLAVLTERQTFDTERLEASPLFKPTVRKLF